MVSGGVTFSSCLEGAEHHQPPWPSPCRYQHLPVGAGASAAFVHQWLLWHCELHGSMLTWLITNTLWPGWIVSDCVHRLGLASCHRHMSTGQRIYGQKLPLQRYVRFLCITRRTLAFGPLYEDARWTLSRKHCRSLGPLLPACFTASSFIVLLFWSDALLSSPSLWDYLPFHVKLHHWLDRTREWVRNWKHVVFLFSFGMFHYVSAWRHQLQNCCEVT